jgi:hypothetical protein
MIQLKENKMINSNNYSQYQNTNLKFGTLIKVNIDGIPKTEVQSQASKFIKNLEMPENKDIAVQIKETVKDFLASSARIFKITDENTMNLSGITGLPEGFIQKGDVFIATGKHSTSLKVAEKAINEASKTKNKKMIESKQTEAENIYNTLIKGREDFIPDNEILDIKMDIKPDNLINYSIKFDLADKLKSFRNQLDIVFKPFRENPDSITGSVIRVKIPGFSLEQQDKNLQVMLTKLINTPKHPVNNAFISIDQTFNPNNVCFFSLCDTEKKKSTISFITTDGFADLTDEIANIRKKFPNDSSGFDEIIHEYMEEITKKQSNKRIDIKYIHGIWSAKVKKND